MRVGFDQLAGQLGGAQRAVPLRPVYLLFGDEPLQLTEGGDLIRRACRKHGFEERQVYTVLPGFDWNLLAQETDALSLFAGGRLLDVRVPDGKVGSEGTRVLSRYAERPPEATVLLLILENFPPGGQKAAWFARLEAIGMAIQTHPLSGQGLMAWLEGRARSRGLDLDHEALELLAFRTEGNLLAAAQEIDKLYVLYGSARVNSSMLAEAVADSARFDVFDLTEAWLLGEVRRVDRTLAGLRAEGVAPAVVLWAIARELRLLLQLLDDRRAGVPLPESCRRLRLWDRRKAQAERALRRLKPATLHAALEAACRIDAAIKGRSQGDVWAQLRDVCLALATPETICFSESD